MFHHGTGKLSPVSNQLKIKKGHVLLKAHALFIYSAISNEIGSHA